MKNYYIGGGLRLLIFCTIRDLEHLNFGSNFDHEGSFFEINCIIPFFLLIKSTILEVISNLIYLLR